MHDDVIVRSTIELAHSLGVEVVAEGVESEDVLHTLRALGCGLAQGAACCRGRRDEWLLGRRSAAA